ncbi:MAG TPA: addiction module protein [Spirochaetota bacterium]|nr:addiction module protein [Spirochaetota bacterium]
MTQTAQKILEEIKSLSPIERVELIDKIYQTFDPEIDFEVEKAWGKESERRLADYKNGKSAVISEDEAFYRIEKDKKK